MTKWTYPLNIENTGLDSDEKVQRMVDLMQADGHRVTFTRDLGHVPPVDDDGCPSISGDDPIDDSPWSEDEWLRYLVLADADV